jgi:hypothetical protein
MSVEAKPGQNEFQKSGLPLLLVFDPTVVLLWTTVVVTALVVLVIIVEVASANTAHRSIAPPTLQREGSLAGWPV